MNRKHSKSEINPKGAGRPFTEINWKVVDRLCGKQCTLGEISEVLGVSEDTLERATEREHECKFADYFATKRKIGHYSLRSKQFDLAMRGDKTMLIWLGKQYLDQRDKTEVRQDTDPLAELLAEFKIEHEKSAVSVDPSS